MQRLDEKKYRKILGDLFSSEHEFRIDSLPFFEDQRSPINLATTSLSLPLVADHNTFVCVPIKSEDVVWWCFGDIEKQNSTDIEDVRTVIANSFVEYLKIEETDQKLINIWPLLKSFFASDISIFAVPSELQDKFTEIIFPVFSAIKNRPKWTTDTKRSSGVIRRDFEYALFLKNEKLARMYLDEWRDGNRLDAENAIYLEIYLDLTLGNYEFIFQNDYQKLRAIRDLRVPPEIRRQVCEAIYDFILFGLLDTDGWQKAVKKYSNERLSFFDKFFDLDVIQSPKAFALSLLHEICRANPNVEKLQRLCSQEQIAHLPITKSVKRDFLVQQDEVEPLIAAKTDPLEKAKELVMQSEFGLAFPVILEAEKTESSLRLLTAILRQTLTDINKQRNQANLALSYWNDTPEELRIELMQNTPFEFRIFEEIYQILTSPSEADDVLDVEKSEVNSWKIWMTLLDDENKIESARVIFHKHFKNWSIASLANDENATNTFAEYLLAAPGSPNKNDLIDELLPTLLEEFIGENDNFDPRLKPVYFSFLEILTLEATNLDLQVIGEVQSVLFDCSLSQEEGQDLIELLKTVLQSNASFQNLNLFLDTIELISLKMAVNTPAALSYFYEVRKLALNFAHRLDLNQIHVLELVFKDFSTEFETDFLNRRDSFSNEDEFTVNVDLNGKLIGIYSLVDDAAKRAASFISEQFPGCSIKLNNDKQCTEKLRSLAKNSDLFVFASKASKHQAFYCIKNNRPSSLPEILIPDGKGSTSIIRSLMNSF